MIVEVMTESCLWVGYGLVNYCTSTTTTTTTIVLVCIYGDALRSKKLELRILLVADIAIKVLELNGHACIGGAVGTLSRC